MLDRSSTAAVIGASGFIGRATVRALGQRGVTCAEFTRAAPFVRPDGTLDPALLASDVVFWLASSIRPAETESAANDQNALHALISGLVTAGAQDKRIVVVSSGGTVYDPTCPPPYSEVSPTHAANTYGEAMLAIETLLRESWEDHVIVRASNAYGPGQPVRRGQGVIAHWLDSVRRGEPIRVIGDDQVSRDYLYIDDLVEALAEVAIAIEPPRLINVGSGTPTSLAYLLEVVTKTIPREIVVERAPARGFDAPSTWLDVTLAATSLGWKPRTTLPEGIERTWHALVQGQPPTV